MPANTHSKSPVRLHKSDCSLSIRIKHWLPVIMCMGFIFYTSSIPGSDIPPVFPFQDIIYHFLIYLLLGLSFTQALKRTYMEITLSKLIISAILFGVIYGLTDELHQAFVPGRSVSGWDVFIDGIGSFAGGWVRFLKK